MKRKLLSILLTLCMMLTLLPTAALAAEVTANTAWYTNATEGTTEYTISTEADLLGLAQLVNRDENAVTFEGKTITLASNITLTTTNWTPIGNGSRDGKTYSGNAFKGTFDGDDHIISNLKITSDADKAALGLFGVVDGGTVKDLGLTNVNISATNNGNTGAAIGLMVGGAVADSITVSGTVTGKDGVGGIVGRMTVSGTITGCTNKAAVEAVGTGQGKAGGIIGAAFYTAANNEMTISSCTNNGAVTSGAGYVGGIAGLSAAKVSNCTNTAAITGTGTSIGGIVGEQANYGSVIGCNNSGDVTNNKNSNDAFGTGGIVGWVRYPNESSDYPLKAVIEVKNNTNSGTITGGWSAGGIVGSLYNAATVTGNENTAESVSAAEFAAGIVGSFQVGETPVQGSAPSETIPQAKLNCTNNVSTTASGSITTTNATNCVAQYVYNNPAPGVTDEGSEIRDNSAAWVAKIGEDRYVSLADAINDADNKTVTLLKDVTLTSVLTIPSGRTLTLDLNGKTLSRANNTVIANNGTLTVKNGKVHMTGSGNYVGYFAIINSGTLTLESTLTVESDRGNAVLNTAGTLNTAANMKAVYSGNAATQRGSGILLKGGTVNVTDGTIEYMQYALSTNAAESTAPVANVTGGTMAGYRTAIYWPIGNLNLGNEDGTGPTVEILKDTTKNNTGLGTPLEIAGGTVNVKGGTFKGISTTFYADKDYFADSGSTNMGDAITVYTRRGADFGDLSLTISGGTFTSENNYAMRVLDVANVDTVTTTINISGGKFTSAAGKDAIHVAKKSAATIASNITNPAITGGTFSTDPSAYVASGYYVVKNISTTATADTWTVYQRTYSGGSSSSNTTTSTVTNPDGSVTTTTTNKTTGVTTEVTKNTDGSVDTVITNKDGSTTESTKTAGGTSATVETDKNGDTTSVSASVSSTDAKNANKSGGSVSLPLTGVTPAASSEEAQTIDIDVPSNVSSVTVEIPVEDVTPGTVVIIVNKDGTETIVPTSTVTENGIEVTLTEDATIKIVDNSKTFKDVPESNVFHDEIAAMSARGIMVGKTDDTFDVYGDVTLNQIVNVAGRVSGAVATEDYEGGIAWGEANGLATGDTPATRGQVILALYVAAGSPDAMDTGKLSAYSDGASVPSELLSAVLWAVENGILKGTDAGTLDLGSNVTRGQAAAFAGRTLGVIG